MIWGYHHFRKHPYGDNVWYLQKIYLWGSLKTDYTFDDAHEVSGPQWGVGIMERVGAEVPSCPGKWTRKMSRCISYWRWGYSSSQRFFTLTEGKYVLVVFVSVTCFFGALHRWFDVRIIFPLGGHLSEDRAVAQERTYTWKSSLRGGMSSGIG